MGSVLLCVLLLAVMPDPRKSRHSSYSAIPQVTTAPAIVESSNEDLKTLSKSEYVNGLISALSNRNTLLVIPVFLVGIFRYAMLNLLIQYASVRFGLKISKGASFYTETAVINICLFLLLVPWLTTYVRSKYNVRLEIIDLFLVKSSVILLTSGCLAIGLAQSSEFLPIGK